MREGDKVRVIQTKDKGKTGRIVFRHVGVIPKGWRNVREGERITREGSETLFAVQLDDKKEVKYFPESHLELIAD